VEQILPNTEHGPDPRDFYASDSPVLDECFDASQGSGCVDPEVEDDDQVESIIACHVQFSYLTYTSQANWCEQVVSDSHSRCPMSRNADLGQLESHTNTAGIPDQIVNGLDGTQGQTSGGNAGQQILK
jgi:hypothetical protein